MMRPTPARWFELLAARDDALAIAELLAAAGCAEFEAAAEAPQGPAAAQCARHCQRFRDLERHYRQWWPVVARPAPHAIPSAVLAQALARIEAWAAVAAPEIAAAVAAEAELAALAQWQALLAEPGFGAGERAALAGAGRLAAALFYCTRRDELRPPEGLLAKPLGAGWLFAVGAPAAVAELAEQVSALGGRRLDVPEWIAAADAPARLTARRERCREIIAAARRRLAALAREHGLAEAVAEARCGCWYLDNVGAVEERRALWRVTGWTSDPEALRHALADGGVRALLRFPAPPPGLQPPLLLYNPWWARPYEVFARLLGMPARDAADPSALVALIFPLLFGYMFGDLGQGLVLVAVGLAAGRRWPLARLFVPAGLSAALFGLAFGSVFSLSGIIAPLWLEPLAQPLPVLLLPLFGGAALLLFGLGLAAVEAHWRGQLAAWLRAEGGALVLYLGVLAALAAPAGFAVPLLVTALALAALLALGQGGGVAAVVGAFAGSLEKTLQLAINTISFVRVGAFAIAHAGLSATLALLAAAAGEVASVALVIVGNVFIIALEVLVVSVQATRLLLFEFFTRFFIGSGRAFRPLPPPAAAPVPEVRHEA